MTNKSHTKIDFSSYITERTRHFTGRGWVFERINDWLADPDPDASRFFLLTGEPGSGKSAIAARLTQFSQAVPEVEGPNGALAPGFLSAFHFCSVRDRRWINPHVFAESLALQLAARYPVYAQALVEKSGERQIHLEVTQTADVIDGLLDIADSIPSGFAGYQAPAALALVRDGAGLITSAINCQSRTALKGRCWAR